MKSVKFVLHFIGILFFPFAIFVLSAVIWQNNGAFVEGFSLVGNLWKIERIALYQLLLVFLLAGAFLPLCLLFLLRSERRLFQALAKLRQLERQEKSAVPQKAVFAAEAAAQKEESAKPSEETGPPAGDA